jgi:multiple RNA-binding domain-containing protein 1
VALAGALRGGVADQHPSRDGSAGEVSPTPATMATRVCVKQLPKHATDARVRELFSGIGPVTDCRLMKSKDGRFRQFAFVGFPTPALAEAALKLDKTFIGASRIRVELAFEQGASETVRPWSRHSRGSSRHQAAHPEAYPVEQAASSEKDGSADTAGDAPDHQFEEFKVAMANRNTRPTWANDDAIPDQQAPVAAMGSASSSDVDDDDAEEADEEEAEAADEQDLDALLKAAEARADEEGDASAAAMQFLQKKQQSDSEEDSGDESDDSAGYIEDGVVRERPSKRERDESDDDLADLRMDDSDSEDDMPQPKKAKKRPRPSAEAAAKEEGGGSSAASTGLDEGRLFVRNLPFIAEEGDLSAHFASWGEVSSVRILRDPSGRSKGLAYVSFAQPACAASALAGADKKMFQGRLIHVMSARKAPEGAVENSSSKGVGRSAFKDQQEAERREAAASGSEEGAWNALFVRSDAAVKAAAAAQGVSVSEVLDPTADNLAVRTTLGEVAVIEETKAFLKAEGVDLDAVQRALAGRKLDPSQRSSTVILVKNLPHTTSQTALRGLFARHGALLRVVLPPARVLALIEFEREEDAKRAFRALAYKKFESVPLYLEWAPSHAFSTAAAAVARPEPEPVAPAEEEADQAPAAQRTVYVKGLSFDTPETGLESFFSGVGRIRAVHIPKRGSGAEAKSMGYGFVEFDSAESAVKAIKKHQGKVLDGHALELSISKKSSSSSSSAAVDRSTAAASSSAVLAPSKTATKILVKNLAFEATRDDLRELFGAFGKLRSVRVPRKPDGSARGFGFVEFASATDAQLAVKSLGAAHLYGRHLVLQWAKDDGSVSALQEQAAKQVAKESQFAGGRHQ